MNIRFIIKKHLQGDDYTGHAEVNDQLVSGIVGSGKTQQEALEEIKTLFEARLLYGLFPSLNPIVSENRNIVGFIHEYVLEIKPNTLNKYILHVGLFDEATESIVIESTDQEAVVRQFREEYPHHNIFSLLKVSK